MPSPQNEARADARVPAAGLGARRAPATPARRKNVARQESKDQMKALSKLGTGHGRNEESRVTRHAASTARRDSPAETVAIQYDRRENLIAMGVLPRPTPYLARREPNPDPSPARCASRPTPGRKLLMEQGIGGRRFARWPARFLVILGAPWKARPHRPTPTRR